MDGLTFGKKFLFGPLGISDVDRPSNPQGTTVGYSEFFMKPRDMAKIGYLYLNNGLWDGKRIISSQWIKESTRKHVDTPGPYSYGYHWWRVSPDIYLGGGEGPFILVVPERNIVAVFTSYQDEYPCFTIGLLSAYIIPAVKSPTPLPENPDGDRMLKSAMTLWQTINPSDRRKVSGEAEETSQRLNLEEYVNNEYGFSVKFDEELQNMHNQLVSPLVFKRSALRGLPGFEIFVDNVPPAMALENTGNYLIGYLKKIPQITDLKIKKQESVRLSDGTKE
jgi:hypothetical protein